MKKAILWNDKVHYDVTLHAAYTYVQHNTGITKDQIWTYWPNHHSGSKGKWKVNSRGQTDRTYLQAQGQAAPHIPQKHLNPGESNQEGNNQYTIELIYSLIGHVEYILRVLERHEQGIYGN